MSCPRAAALAGVALAAGLSLPGAARAQTLYVIEQLVVNVNSAPDGSGERVATLKSGERVEVLERSGDAVHVRLPAAATAGCAPPICRQRSPWHSASPSATRRSAA